MKQHISEEQLKELSLDQLEFLIRNNYNGHSEEIIKRWAKDIYEYWNGIRDKENKFECLLLFKIESVATRTTIGRLIDILYKEEDYTINMIQPCATVMVRGTEIVEHELCDALWIAVLDLLNQKGTTQHPPSDIIDNINTEG